MRTLFKRRWVWATVLLVAVVAAGYLFVPVAEGRISEASCDEIEIGWTREQVAEALGRPWSVYIANVE